MSALPAITELFPFDERYLPAVVILVITFTFVGLLCIIAWRAGARNRKRNPTSQRDRARQSLPELEAAVSKLNVRISELREQPMWAEWLEQMPDLKGGETPVEDRLRFARLVSARLDDVQRESERRRRDISRFSKERQDAGFRADALRAAAHLAPASAMSWLYNVVAELENQRSVNRALTEDLRGRIQDARQLCNREIANAVARRLPLHLLGVAEEMLEHAVTDAEVQARQEVVLGLLDAIYNQYFPSARRRQR